MINQKNLKGTNNINTCFKKEEIQTNQLGENQRMTLNLQNRLGLLNCYQGNMTNQQVQ